MSAMQAADVCKHVDIQGGNNSSLMRIHKMQHAVTAFMCTAESTAHIIMDQDSMHSSRASVMHVMQLRTFISKPGTLVESGKAPGAYLGQYKLSAWRSLEGSGLFGQETC